MGQSCGARRGVTGRDLARAGLAIVDRSLSLVFQGLVLIYRYLVSPVLPHGCRYAPSCSLYAIEALREHGATKGGWLALHRIARCHPWGGSGFDPVPNAHRPAAPTARHATVAARRLPSSDVSEPIGPPL